MMAAEVWEWLNHIAPKAPAEFTKPPALLTKLPAERATAIGNPQALRDKTNAASADHVRIFFMTGGSFHIPHAESS